MATDQTIRKPAAMFTLSRLSPLLCPRLHRWRCVSKHSRPAGPFNYGGSAQLLKVGTFLSKRASSSPMRTGTVMVGDPDFCHRFPVNDMLDRGYSCGSVWVDQTKCNACNFTRLGKPSGPGREDATGGEYLGTSHFHHCLIVTFVRLNDGDGLNPHFGSQRMVGGFSGSNK